MIPFLLTSGQVGIHTNHGTRWVQWVVSRPSRFNLEKKSSRYHMNTTGCVLELLWSWQTTEHLSLLEMETRGVELEA
jgi:hypothetical protein